MSLKIGVLILQSKTYATIGRDFIDGLELATKNCAVEFVVENIGVGAQIGKTIDAVHKMVIRDRVQLVTGLIGHHQIELLVKFMDEINIPLFYSDLGAKIPTKQQMSPWTFCNSFDLFLSSLFAAKSMVKNGYSKIAISSNFNDVGYGFGSILEKGLYESGGCFAGHYITPHKPRADESEQMKEFINKLAPDAIYAQHNGAFAREYASFLQQSHPLLNYPIYASHFAIDNEILDDFPNIFQNARCITSWMVEECNQANQQFVANYQATYGRTPSVFAMLGYENGQAIAASLGTKDTLTPKEILTHLETIEFNSPRGRFKFHPNTHRTHFQQSEWLIKKANAAYQKEVSELFENLPELTMQLMANDTSTSTGGWYNAYLCH